MFFKGAILQCTYNKDGVSSNAQLSIFCDVPQKIDPDIFQRIKLLAFPPTIKYDASIFDFNLPKDQYLQIGFKEV